MGNDQYGGIDGWNYALAFDRHDLHSRADSRSEYPARSARLLYRCTRVDRVVATSLDPDGESCAAWLSRDARITRMVRHDIGRLPVVRRDNPRQVVGYLGRASVMTARLRRHEEEHHREPGWLQAFS